MPPLSKPISGIYNRGTLIDSFTLTVPNSITKNKGDLCAEMPLFWGAPFIDLGKHAGSKLWVMLSSNNKLKGRYVKLTINMACLYYGNPKNGKINFKYQNGSSKNTGSITVSSGTVFIDYPFSTATLKGDDTSIEISSTDFDDVSILSVKVEIYEPYLMVNNP
jgi:hypothetical protein